VHQFAATPQTEKSYNFVECDTTRFDETPTLLTDGSFDFCTGHFKEETSDFDDSTAPPTAKTDEETEEKIKMLQTFIGEIMENVGQAIDEGKCDIKNIESICSIMSEKNFDGKEEDMKMINDTLHKAEECKAEFENLDDLGKYLKKECTNDLIHKYSLEPLSKKLMECDLQIDENIVGKQVPDDMILGLVEPKLESADSVTSNKESDDGPPSPVRTLSDERKENIRMVEGFITDAIDDIKDSDVETEENDLPTFNCDMPNLQGIGKACSQKTIDAFLIFILSQARDEKGMVYPRFLKDPNCPVMTDSLN